MISLIEILRYNALRCEKLKHDVVPSTYFILLHERTSDVIIPYFVEIRPPPAKQRKYIFTLFNLKHLIRRNI